MVRRHELVPSATHVDVAFNSVVCSIPTSLTSNGKLPLYTVKKIDRKHEIVIFNLMKNYYDFSGCG